MKRAAMLLLTLGAYFLSAAWTRPRAPSAPHFQAAQPSLFEQKLDKRIERFDTAGRTLIASLIDLAYEYELPMGIEYLDRDAASRPINVELRNESLRGILVALVQQLSEYRVGFSSGIVDVYAPKAREDTSNMLNKVIKSFNVSEVDTHRADMELSCTLARELTPPRPCAGSIGLGQWGPLKITVSFHNATAYEILNAIVSQNGKAIWTVMAPPEKLSEAHIGGLWHIYPLEPPFRGAVLDKLKSIHSKAP